MMKFLICLAAFLAAASAECEQPSVTTPLLLANFSGVWYQWASYGSFLYQGSGDCAKAEYTLNNVTGVLDVNNTQSSVLGYLEVDGTAQLADPNTGAGILVLTLSTLVGDKTSSLSVLDTDYDTYAILYNCKSGWLWDTDASWILTRARQPDSTVIDKILDSLANIRASESGVDLSIVDYDETYQDEDCTN